MNAQEIKLLPCPFCASSDLTLTVNRSGWKIVECDDCGMKGPCIDLEGDQYLERWNTRLAAQADASGGEDKRLPRELADREPDHGQYASLSDGKHGEAK